jgi:hypothetical protein
LRVKIRDEGLLSNKAVHVALGVRADGAKEILGLWLKQDEIHYLRKQRPPSVHDKASRPKPPGELQPNSRTDFKSTPSKIARNLLAYCRDSIDQSRLTGQQ